MTSLKEIRTRISSVKTTRQVTSAMKMVSAAKLKKAQDSILQIRPYADKLHEILTTLSASLENSEDSAFTEQRSPEKVLIVLISSNRGLCGAFNSSIAKTAYELAINKYNRQLKEGNLEFLVIGKQGEKYLKSRKMPIAGEANDLFDKLSFEESSVIASSLMQDFIVKKYDRIELVYNQFKNAAVQLCSAEQFLPVEVNDEIDELHHSSYHFIYEPSKEEIVKELIPRSLRIQFYKALLDSNAAEHGARMTAMHKATDNATDLIKELTLTFNKARQAAITNEILEVTNGAEALNG
ncbi:ATP synthase F1 subunit gamma [Sunxiuqinia elliptica]|uniref:ATP synthase gamma chain n=1 Tax=Sunxiuqinia elliptica TaxID=655355 RepID=A0A1I2AQW5_9BACT|nr:ATP synthase F1 subunit gamma [Sunxiuqinia elliptica]SFE46425.1 F-type H+-transporting ATPase subunit gamma [Sunxiuqinia elliptica]